MARATAREGAPAAVLRRIGRFAGALQQELELEDVRTGSWFTRLLAAWLRHYEQQGLHKRATGRTPEATRALIERACLEVGVSGAGAAAVATGASVYAAQTGGAGALVALPVGVVAVGGEMMLRVLVHLRLTCDLAAAFGVRFRPEHPADLALLYALVFGTERHEDALDPGQDLVGRLVHKEVEDLGEQLGGKLMGESAMRNLLPFANVVTSAVANVRRTRHLGEVVLCYARSRRVLEDALAAVRRVDESAEELLLESLWFLYTADGRLRHEEAALLASLLRRAPVEVSGRVLDRMVVDEADWLKRLRGVPERVREPFLQALCVASASDLEAPPAERRVLNLAAHTLGRVVEPQRLEAMVSRLEREGEVPAAPAVVAIPKRKAPRPRERPAHAPH